MIQPVGAFSPRAVFRGSNNTYGKQSKGLTTPGTAIVNASGIAAVAGGLTTAIARSHTSSWGYAAVLGLFASFLTALFMVPQLIDSTSKSAMERKAITDGFIKSDAVKTAEVMRGLKPAKKLVQFRQS